MVDKENCTKCCVHFWRLAFIILNSLFFVSWSSRTAGSGGSSSSIRSWRDGYCNECSCRESRRLLAGIAKC